MYLEHVINSKNFVRLKIILEISKSDMVGKSRKPNVGEYQNGYWHNKWYFSAGFRSTSKVI